MAKITDLRGKSRPRPADHLAPGGTDRGDAQAVSVSFYGNAAGPWAMVDTATGTVLCTGFGISTYQAMLTMTKLMSAALVQLLPERVEVICTEVAAEIQRQLDAATAAGS